MLIALIIATIIQGIAAWFALRISRSTSHNYSWYLITIAFGLIVVRRTIEAYSKTFDHYIHLHLTYAILSIIISLLFLFSLNGIRQILSAHIKLKEAEKKHTAAILKNTINTEEQTRSRFAMELHDGLGPLLSIAQMNLSVLEGCCAKNREGIAPAKQLIDEAISTLREVSNGLSPRVLMDFGLKKAIDSFIGKLPENNAPDIHFYYNLLQERYPFELEITIYRLVCELINNGLKYAQAKDLKIHLTQYGNLITIRCTDNGKGLDAASLENNIKGQGFLNLQSRIKALNGDWIIRSIPQKGTYIHVKFDINTSDQ